MHFSNSGPARPKSAGARHRRELHRALHAPARPRLHGDRDDEGPTNKPTYHQRFGEPFDATCARGDVRVARIQPLAVFAVHRGRGQEADPRARDRAGERRVLRARARDAAGHLPARRSCPRAGTSPGAVLYVAPPFRHTHFEGRQVVVHNRTDGLHELFSYNLYPGPSAKKGIYGVLLNLGEAAGLDHRALLDGPRHARRTTTTSCSCTRAPRAAARARCSSTSTARRRTLLLGENTTDGERACLTLPARVRPLPRDRRHGALPPEIRPTARGRAGKLTLTDAEDAWFVRVNHIDSTASTPTSSAVHPSPSVPLLFLNIDAARTRPR
jgi:hypothetical protein